MTHHCHARNCTTACQPEYLMCSRHWSLVPYPLRKQVLATYCPGQCDDKSPSEAWIAAADAAIDAVFVLEHTLAIPDKILAVHAEFSTLTYAHGERGVLPAECTLTLPMPMPSGWRGKFLALWSQTEKGFWCVGQLRDVGTASGPPPSFPHTLVQSRLITRVDAAGHRGAWRLGWQDYQALRTAYGTAAPPKAAT